MYNLMKAFLWLSVQSWTSDKERAIETGKSFLTGLELDPEDIVVDNSKATYYKDEYGCEKYVYGVSVCWARAQTGKCP